MTRNKSRRRGPPDGRQTRGGPVRTLHAREFSSAGGLAINKAPQLILVANLWTLAGHPSARREWPLAKKISMIAKEGFNALTAAATPELAPLLRKTALRYTGFFSSSSPREFTQLIRAQREAGAENINVQLGDDFTPARKTLAWTLALQREAKRQGIYVSLEV